MSFYLDADESGRAIHRLLEREALARPNDVFYQHDEAEYSVGQFNDGVNRLARGLADAGVGPGTRVAVFMESSPQYLELWFALAKLGAVEVPINTAYRGQLLHYQLDNSQASHVVIDDQYARRIFDIVGKLPALEAVLVSGDLPADWPQSALLDLAELPASNGDNLASTASPSDLACVIYTSGTTGPSKGVMISHSHEFSFGCFYADITELTASDVTYNYLPFFHIAGKFLTIATLLAGARMVLQPRLSIDNLWRDARRHGVTNFVAVGGVCHMLYGRTPQPHDENNPVKTVYAVPAPKEIYTEFERRFDVRLVEAYGATESNLVLHTSPSDIMPGSCGRPNELFEVSLVDEYDRPVETGEAGEIVIRPREPHLTMMGYLGMPEKTVDVWRNLWLHTGDRATRSDDGYFWFQDRMKDSIRRRGENISSLEVETVINGHPDVAETAAVGVPSELGEEEVKIVVVPTEERQPTHLDLWTFAAEKLPYFMVPRFIEIRTELPRTPTAKVEKYRLRSEADGRSDAAWDAEEHGLRVTRDGIATVD